MILHGQKAGQFRTKSFITTTENLTIFVVLPSLLKY